MKAKISLRGFLIITSIVFVIITLVVVSIYSENMVMTYIKEKTNQNYRTNLDQLVNKFNSDVDDIYGIIFYVTKNDAIVEYSDILDSSPYPYDALMAKTEILSTYDRILLNNNTIFSISIFLEKKLISSGPNAIFKGLIEDIRDLKELYKVLKDNKGKPVFIYNLPEIKEIITSYGMEKEGELFCGVLFEREDGNESVVLIMVNPDYFETIFKDVSLLITDSKGKLIYNSTEYSKDIIQTKNIDKEVTLFQKESENGWLFTYVVDQKETRTQLRNIRYYSIISLLVGLLSLSIVIKLIIGRITQSIEDIITGMKEYRKDRKVPSEIHIPILKHRVSLRRKLVCYLIIATFLPSNIYIITFYTVTTGIIQEKVLESATLVFNQTHENLDKYFKKRLNTIKNIAFSNDTLRFLQEKDHMVLNPSSNFVLDNIEKNILMDKNYMQIQLYNKNLILKLENNNRYDSDYYNSDETKKFLIDSSNKIGTVLWISPGQDLCGRHWIDIMMPVRDTEMLDVVGYIKGGIDELLLEKIYTDIKNPYFIVAIVNKNGIIFSHSDKSKIGRNIKDYGVLIDSNSIRDNKNGSKSSGNKDYMNNDINSLKEININNTELYLVGIYDYNDINKENLQLLLNQIKTLIIILLLSIILSSTITQVLFNSFYKINNFFKNLDFGSGLNKRMEANTPITEIDELCITFNEMVDRIERLIEQVRLDEKNKLKLKEDKRFLEIQALQAQINPHFLCNTLESIRCLIDERENESASKMMRYLNNLFKYGISREEPLITIEQELVYAKSYMTIINMRFGGKIQTKWRIDSELLYYKTLKLILQPVIENAIQHGMEGIESMNINIVCTKAENKITFFISDNGRGIEPEKLEKLKNSLKEGMYDAGIGIANVDRRIKIYFGDEYGLNMESVFGKGTTVIITIPIVV